MITFFVEGVSPTAAILRPAVVSIYSPKNCFAHVGNIQCCHHLGMRAPQETIQCQQFFHVFNLYLQKEKTVLHAASSGLFH